VADQQLSRLQMEILEFERATWSPRSLGRRDAAILERFGHTPIRHAQLVLHILRLPAAAAYDPTLVRQLLARQDQRAAAHNRRGFEVAQ
jgi:hypothetical protein